LKSKVKSVISASRRTDLPAFYYELLQDYLKIGEVELVNPRFKEKTYKVDLRPENVHSMVLWSKDFRNVLKDPMHLENYNLYFQYTINNYTKILEPYAPTYQETITILEGLLYKYRPEQFNIRFDPIIISVAGEPAPTPEKPGLARLRAFEMLCKDLLSLGMRNCRVTTSYICLYGHVKQRLAELGVKLVHLDDTLQVKFATKMAEIASKYGIVLYSCASPVFEQVPEFQKGSCIDGKLLESVFGGKVSQAHDAGQRRACNCSKSSDIGRYDQFCGFSCAYCYAPSAKHVSK
jgi:hypothetical protein